MWGAAMIDAQTLKERVDLLAMAEHDTQLRKVASTGGGEWAGPCVFCGGRDRFRVQPYHPGGGRWLCRNCTDGKWQDAIAYKMRRDGLDFKAACEALGAGELPTTARTRPPAKPQPAYNPPAGDWQEIARGAIATCHKKLFEPEGESALDYLLSRGLAEPAINRFMLGYSPGAKWGGMLYVPRGVVIPCIVGGEIWYLKIALLPGDRVKCEGSDRDNPHYTEARKPCLVCGATNKYRGVKGNRTAAIFNAGDLVGAELALFCEGEIDCITAWQELSDRLAVVTLGGANTHPDLAAWGAYLLGLRRILVTYDRDQAGDKGAAFWSNLSERVKIAPLPDGHKDINAYYCAGGDLRAWMEERSEG